MSDDVGNIQQEQAHVEPQTQAPQTPDYAAEASAQGWVAKDDYRGNEADWVDAETFVRRGKEIMPILRKNNEKLLKELKEARSIAEEARSTAQAKAEANRPEPVQQSAPQPDENLQAWLDRNQWFGQDKRITDVTNALGNSITEEFPTLKGKAFLDKLDEELAQTYPDKFGKKTRANPMDGAGMTTQSGRPSSAKRSYENLPTEAKAACDRFLKQGLIRNKEDYVREYDWSE